MYDTNVIESRHDRVLQEDFEKIVTENSFLEELTDGTVFVTGATGLIGSQVVKTLACLNRIKGKNLRIIAFVRNENKAKGIFGDLLEHNLISLVVGDINNRVKVEENVDYVIHCASETSSRYFVSNPVDTIMTTFMGTRNILEFAREKNVKSMVYLSSLEVYGVPVKEGMTGEKDYGYIDPLSVRSSYSEGKRMAECLCVSYAEQYGVPVRVVRLSQTFGAGVDSHDGRVFAEFARCAVENRDIVLRTEGNTVRSYCYTADAVSAVLCILIRGKEKEAYNVTNMETAISIKDMAQLVCDMAENHIKVVYDIPEDISSFGYNPEMVIKLDCSKVMELGWKPHYSLRDMYARLWESWKVEGTFL